MNTNKVTLVRSNRSWILKFPKRTVISHSLKVITKELHEYYYPS